ncbi:MAG: hypothetical protein JRH08_18855 [Deltaproteobacteria bacterium]|nr:hypothetical protein [Deltaproteobacteria bacterium]MBW1927805.1 hypothetical protein [Deltaproteobacteria bacterium]MBW2027113.1 hypothetical protein [Deltaproteobacteria bacterium]MBW2127647.1 hypothetical protein [Deltaproteobacteria bacterium]
MDTKLNLEELNEKIIAMKSAAIELKKMANSFPAMERNLVRILASIKMLELNVSDLLPQNSPASSSRT